MTPAEIDTAIYDAQVKVAAIARKLQVAQARTWNFDQNLVDQLTAEHAEAHLEALAWEAQYTGWSRFFLVTNTNGHVHRWMSCSTCFPSTQYNWLTELSGMTEAEAVEEYGEILCSICFPSAPVEWTTGENKKAKAERELHKALVAIERSPEGKKVKALKSSLSSKLYALHNEEWKVRQDAEWDPALGDKPAHIARYAVEAPAKIARLTKQIKSYEDKIAAAEAALEEALKS